MEQSTNLGELLKAASFHTNKALGQNFLSDVNLLHAIALDSGVTKDDVVVEIGTGAGTLTRELASCAKKVYSFEVDRNLQSVLDISLKGVDNVEVVFADVLKMSDGALKEIIGEGEFVLVGNLPYYVTTPLLLRFIESPLNCRSISVMVQEEVALRFVAQPNTADYAAITLAVKVWGDAAITRKVSRKMFFPSPNVDSAVVRIDRNDQKLKGENVPYLKQLIRKAFSMRRKTLCNNLSAGFAMDKKVVEQTIVDAGFAPLVRGEVLSLDDYVALSHSFEKVTSNKQ